MPGPSDYTYLLPYCQTQRQRDAVEAHIKHGSGDRAAAALGIGVRRFYDHIARAKAHYGKASKDAHAGGAVPVGFGIKALYVDYIQKIKATDTTTKRHEQVGEVVSALKDLAKELRIPVVALAQVGRQVEARPNKRPHMGDISDSSEIEKEADQIITLYRDEVYNPDTLNKGLMELDICKNRHGPTGAELAVWLPDSMRVVDADQQTRNNWREQGQGNSGTVAGRTIGRVTA